MKHWFLMAAMAFVANVAAAQYVDDLYGPIRSTPPKKSTRTAPSVASAQERSSRATSGSEIEGKELITSYSEALQRRVLAMRNASYDQPESYWELLEQYQTMLERKYNQHLYNIVVVGDQMWVEPQSITAQFDGSDPAAGVIQYNEELRNSKTKKQQQRASSDNGQVNINLNVDPWTMNVWPSVSYTTSVAPNVNISIGYGGGWGWGWPYSYNRWPYYGNYYGGYYGGYYGPSYGWGWPYHGGGYYPPYRPYYHGGYYGGGYYDGYRGNPKGTYYGNSRYNGSYRGGSSGSGGQIQGMSGGRPSGRPNGSNTVYGITGGREDRPSGVAGGGVSTSRPSGRPVYNSNSERPSGDYNRPSRNEVWQNRDRNDRPSARPEVERPAFNRQNTERPSYDRPFSSPSNISRPSGGGSVSRPSGGGGGGGGRPQGR